MQAMLITAFGGPEVFAGREVARPSLAPKELPVRAHATSVNPVDDEIRRAGADVVLDTVGGDTLARCVEITRPRGRMAGIVSATGSLDGAFVRKVTLHSPFLERARDGLDALRAPVERCRVRPVVDPVVPLRDAARARERLEKGGVRGKVVPQVAGT